eukprot:213187-Chlamydomonas_euryale.AAC.1
MSPPSDMSVTLSSGGTARGSAPEVERHSPQQRRAAQAAPPSCWGVAATPSTTTLPAPCGQLQRARCVANHSEPAGGV